MKRIKYIIIAFVLVSCANERKNTVVDKTMEIEQYEDAYVEKSEAFESQHLYTEKLQNYFDLLYLYNSHPGFKEDIIMQLKNISNDRVITTDYNSKIIVENVQNIGVLKTVSDSISIVKLYFEKISDGNVVNDSILAILTKKPILINGIERISTKVSFSNL